MGSHYGTVFVCQNGTRLANEINQFEKSQVQMKYIQVLFNIPF